MGNNLSSRVLMGIRSRSILSKTPLKCWLEVVSVRITAYFATFSNYFPKCRIWVLLTCNDHNALRISPHFSELMQRWIWKFGMSLRNFNEARVYVFGQFSVKWFFHWYIQMYGPLVELEATIYCLVDFTIVLSYFGFVWGLLIFFLISFISDMGFKDSFLIYGLS